MGYILVSQGIEIFRTNDLDEALAIKDEMNADWDKYVKECLDDNELYADNEVFLYEEEQKTLYIVNGIKNKYNIQI